MAKTIYERDFYEEYKCNSELDSEYKPTQQEIDRFMLMYQATGKCADELQSAPRIILPKAKEKYDLLLRKCEDFSRRVGGKIRGEIDYELYGAEIEVIVPYAEFTSYENLEFLREISQNASSVLFESIAERKTRMLLVLDYFQSIIPKAEIEARLEAAQKIDAERISLLETLANMPDATRKCIPIFLDAINRISDHTGLSPLDSVSLFLNKFEAFKFERLNASAINEIADAIIQSYGKE